MVVKETTMNIIVRVKSHRASDKLDRTIGRHPQYYWTMKDGGNFAEVTAEEFGQIKAIKGITKARVPSDDLRRCWNS
jgi:hypothetical protein